MPDGYRFPVDRGTLLGWTVHLFGAYEPEVRAEIRRILQPGDVAIDVGANVGWHALLMAQRVGPSGRVFAFEPNPTTRDRLLAAIQANHFGQVVVDARAAADHAGRMGFTAPVAGAVWDGTGRLLTERDGRTIDCVRLDDVAAERQIERVALIKIDVEGWELSVLRGAQRILREQRPVVLFEFDPAYVSRCGGTAGDLNTLFADAGYELLALSPRQPAAPIDLLADRAGNFLAQPRRRQEPARR
jgi:FkbM family methyltransferase